MANSEPKPNPAADAVARRPPIGRILPGISSETRLNILRLLLVESLPVCELARRFSYTESAMSKQMAVLFQSGIVSRRYGLYMIAPQYLVPGEKAIDLGHMLLRLD